MSQAGYVYIIHGRGTCYIKIGQTTNVFKRLQELQQGVPFTLQLISVQLVEDMNTAETELFEQYEAYRSRGEWFALPPTLLSQWPLEAGLAPIAPEREAPTHLVRQRFFTYEGEQLLALFKHHSSLSTKQMYEALEITTKRDKNRITQYLWRLTKTGIIRKTARAEYEFVTEGMPTE